MALSAWQATIVNESGDVIPSASIEVVDEATGLTATIFSNAGGGSLGNPFSAGTNGFARFYADAGSYTITASDAGSGFSESFNNVRLGNAQGYDVGAGAGEIPRNGDLPTFGGTGPTDVPTNANLSTSIAGTATFSGDVYTFSPSGTGFRALQAGMYLSFRLPSGSSNTTTTPDISYNGTTYVIKWIDGSALVANDLEQTYNKQPILFYFDGTDMLIASDISGSNSNGEWIRKENGQQECYRYLLENITITSASGIGGFVGNGTPQSMPKTFSAAPQLASVTFVSNPVSAGLSAQATTINYTVQYRTVSSSDSANRETYVLLKGRWY